MQNLIDEIEAYERQVWDALVSGDKGADTALLHHSFLGVYSDGFANRVDHSGQLDSGPTVSSYTLDDIRTQSLGDDHVLISYRAKFQRLSRDETEVMYVSSIWRKNVGGWINIFSQDTPAL